MPVQERRGILLSREMVGKMMPDRPTGCLVVALSATVGRALSASRIFSEFTLILFSQSFGVIAPAIMEFWMVTRLRIEKRLRAWK